MYALRGNGNPCPQESRRSARGPSMRAAIVHITSWEFSLDRQHVFGDQGPTPARAGSLHLLVALEGLELHHASALHNFASKHLDEFNPRAEGTSSGNKVVDEHDLVACLHYVPLDAESLFLIVLSLVTATLDGVRHLAPFADHEEGYTHLQGHGREKESPRVETTNAVYLHGFVPRGHGVACLAEKGWVHQEPANVIEALDALVGKIRDRRGELPGQGSILRVLALLFRGHPQRAPVGTGRPRRGF
mmetsp:Transcript_102220/g.329581  ORF Transcript_102220/g.329581 Transcript_102220/m.329581 type:complete len:246 (-) Transcript_102220:41-778(-)